MLQILEDSLPLGDGLIFPKKGTLASQLENSRLGGILAMHHRSKVHSRSDLSRDRLIFREPEYLNITENGVENCDVYMITLY